MPNTWAESFLYGFDPKFVMAITAKVNMVLHGDGSAHILKNDAFAPLSSYSDARLRPVGDDSLRSIPRSRYSPDMCESFDLVISNPPFGITLSTETRNMLKRTFSLDTSAPSEAFFIERCFQLLRPGGRLALVIPESLLNTAEAVDVRLLLYRTLWIKTIVSLPRNLFIDTPTLTSLLFAQKKSPEEIEHWDNAWDSVQSQIDEKIKRAKTYLAGVENTDTTPTDVQSRVLDILHPVVGQDSWFLKRGRNAEVRKLQLPSNVESVKGAVEYYRKTLSLAGFNSLLRHYAFAQLTTKFDYSFPVFVVGEVGYKLSKRKERSRPNELCRFLGISSEQEYPNLHLADEQVRLVIDVNHPERVLDYIRKTVTWD
jgi:type I restriction enzyme M protein